MASVSDDFNRADGGLGANWTAVAGTWTIASNVATRNAVVGSTPGSARYNTDLATSDNSAQVSVVALNASSDVMSVGAACRFSSSAQTYYFVSLQVEVNGTATINLGKMEAGTLTILASTATLTTSFPETIKVQAVGSTIKAFRGGSEVLSVTDTSITTGTRVGLHGRRRASGASWSADNFYAEDVGGGTPSPVTGTLAAATLLATAAIAGTVTAPGVTGTLNGATLAPTAAISGTVAGPNVTGSLTSSTPRATSSINGATTVPTSTGALTATTPAVTGNLTGTVTSPAGAGSLSGTVPRVTANLSGVVTPPTWTGTLATATTLPTAVISGTISGPVYVASLSATTPLTSATVTGTVAGAEPIVERDVTLVRTLPPPITARPLPAAITARRLP